MNGWSPNSVAIPGAYAGPQTDTPISKEFSITAGGSKNLVVKITSSAASGSNTVKLQSAIGSDWQDSKTVTVTGAGVAYIKLNVEVTADQTFLPLLAKGRIVVTNLGGSSITVSSIEILQEL